MRRLLSRASVLLALVLFGCAPSVNASSIALAPRPASRADAVEILTAEPTRSHVRVAWVVVTGDAAAEQHVWREKLRAEAAKSGADAVVLLDSRTSEVVVGSSYGGFTQVDASQILQIRALAIAWK